MSKRLLLSLLLLLVTCSMGMSQKIIVDSFSPITADLSASTHRRNDGNGVACALIKVQLARPGAVFKGNVAGEVEYDHGEYYVYLMNGTKMLQVKLDGFIPLDLMFADYGITAVESLNTYRLVLTLPNVSGQPFDDGKSYFTLTVEPKNAIVQLDGKLRTLEDGVLSDRLQRGRHSYQITAEGFVGKKGSFLLGTEKVNLKETLLSAKAKLTVRCSTSGADIYINEEKKGSSSWSGDLKSGSYLIEVRKEGYKTERRSITLADNENLSVDIPSLVALTGQLDLNYKPIDSEVWIDGVKVGTSPDMFKNLTVGSHRVEIRKEGYQSETKTVTIAEGQTASLSGSLASAVSGTTTDRQTFTVNGVSFTMVRVAGGTFTMGATSEQGSDAFDDEKPAHQVTLSTYSIGETEVTQKLWKAVMGSNPSKFKGAKRPVEQVSWNDCQEFISKLNSATGKTFRLPTEAEWEYASRGGNKSNGYKYSGSNDLDAVVWYESNSGSKTHDVATKQSNELCLYDMSGNVWEWCSDEYGKEYYANSPQMNPQGPESWQFRVIRGGSWLNNARNCRSSNRSYYAPDVRRNYLGLRLALSE